MKTDLFFESNS